MIFNSRYGNLTKELIRTDLKLRYHGSVLGYVWSFLKPLLLFGVLLVVFSKFLRFDYEYYSLHLLLGIIIWNFFSEATILSMNSIIQKGPLMKKIRFPRTIVVFSAIMIAFVMFLFNFSVFFLFFLFLRGDFAWSMMLFPVFVAVLFLIVSGVALLLSSLYVKFRDLLHIWEIMLQLGFWLTPIIYPLSVIPAQYQSVVFLNPFAGIIHGARLVFITHQLPQPEHVVIPLAWGVALFVLGYVVFQKFSHSFAEEL